MSRSSVRGGARLSIAAKVASAALLIGGIGIVAVPTSGAIVTSNSHVAIGVHLTHHVRAPRNFSSHLRSAPRLSVKPAVLSHVTPHATFVVDTNSDVDGSCAAHNLNTCSLRSAINLANSDAGHVDAVILPAGRHVTLTQATVLTVSNNLVIVGGKGASINGNGTQVFYLPDNYAVSITGVHIYNGAAAHGGGIECEYGTLVLNNDVISNNTASSSGGGVYTGWNCNLWVDGTTFAANSAPGSYGGGIYTVGSANITRSTFGGATNAMGNSAYEGGGIYNNDGNDVITNCVFSHNQASPSIKSYGAGIYNDEVMDLVNSTVTSNSMSTGGDGAGVYNRYVLRMTNVAINSNSITGTNDAYGAGFYDSGDVSTLNNVTLTGNSSRVSGGASVYGGAVYIDSYSFDWHGGSITGTVNGSIGQSDYVEGGAIENNADAAIIAGVTITNTSNRALPSEGVEGGAIYNNYYGTFSNLKITGTNNSGTYVDGGAVANDDYANFDAISIATTSDLASSTSGGTIEGGAFVNWEDANINGLSITMTKVTANNATDSVPSTTSSYVDGGAFYSDDYFTGTGININGGTVVVSGGAGYVNGGAIYNDSLATMNNSQAINFKVTADYYIDGGLLYNNDYLMSTNFTLGSSTVRVLGSTAEPNPATYGAIMYNDDQTNIVNGTFDNVTSIVGAGALADSGIYNYSQLQLSNATIANDNIAGPNSHLLYGAKGYVSLRNSIVQGIVAAKNCAVGVGVIQSAGFNIDSGISCHFNFSGDMKGVNPQVLALANNGGPIYTAALKKPTSPAINHGSNFGCPTKDARGVSRPQHGTCDIGAYELV